MMLTAEPTLAQTLEQKSLPVHFTLEEVGFDYKEYNKKFGNNKKLLPGYENQCLLALSFYPKLTDIKIEFIFEPSSYTLSARPTPSSVFKKGKERTYQIVVSNKIKKELEPVLFNNLPLEEQVGVIGHELSHVADYIEKNTFQILEIAIMYKVHAFKSKIEHETDHRAVEHGFGLPLHSYCDRVGKLHKKYPDEKYYKDYTTIYMSCELLENTMASCGNYKPY